MGSKDKARREAKKPKAKKPKGQPAPTTSIIPPHKPTSDGGSESK